MINDFVFADCSHEPPIGCLLWLNGPLRTATDNALTDLFGCLPGQVLTLLGILVAGAGFERVGSRPTAAS
jgi:hypothetical protein